VLKILILHRKVTRGRITKNAPLLYAIYSIIRVFLKKNYNKKDLAHLVVISRISRNFYMSFRVKFLHFTLHLFSRISLWSHASQKIVPRFKDLLSPIPHFCYTTILRVRWHPFPSYKQLSVPSTYTHIFCLLNVPFSTIIYHGFRMKFIFWLFTIFWEFNPG